MADDQSAKDDISSLITESKRLVQNNISKTGGIPSAGPHQQIMPPGPIPLSARSPSRDPRHHGSDST
jgi:hypothetical protein